MRRYSKDQVNKSEVLDNYCHITSTLRTLLWGSRYYRLYGSLFLKILLKAIIIFEKGAIKIFYLF